MKTLIKGDPVTAAARTEVGIIPTFLIFSLDILFLRILLDFLLGLLGGREWMKC